MATMLEKAAHAAYTKVAELRSGWVAGSDGLKAYEAESGFKLDTWPDTVTSLSADDFRAATRAALEAIRTPDQKLSGDVFYHATSTEAAYEQEQKFTAMIDAILAEG